MNSRESAISKLEAWARYEMGNRPTGLPGLSLYKSPGYLPGDQADHMTVEIALKDLNATPTHGGGGAYEPHALKRLLLHVYGEGRVPESFELFAYMLEEEDGGTRALRNKCRSFLFSYGWMPDRFAVTAVRRFVRYLSARLSEEKVAV
jgi:hypothetical protein